MTDPKVTNIIEGRRPPKFSFDTGESGFARLKRNELFLVPLFQSEPGSKMFEDSKGQKKAFSLYVEETCVGVSETVGVFSFEDLFVTFLFKKNNPHSPLAASMWDTVYGSTEIQMDIFEEYLNACLKYLAQNSHEYYRFIVQKSEQ